MHAGWAGRLTGAAVEAAEHVLDERIGNLRAAFIERPHHANAAARRIHLTAQHAIGRARRKAQAAMDAVEVERRFLLSCIHPGPRILLVVPSLVSPSTWRPGFSRPSGSKASFILFIRSYSASVKPNVGTSRLA